MRVINHDNRPTKSLDDKLCYWSINKRRTVGFIVEIKRKIIVVMTNSRNHAMTKTIKDNAFFFFFFVLQNVLQMRWVF